MRSSRKAADAIRETRRVHAMVLVGDTATEALAIR